MFTREEDFRKGEEMKTVILTRLLLVVVIVCQGGTIVVGSRMNTLQDAPGSTREISPELDKLMAKLSSRSAVEKANAISELARMGPKAAPAVLLLILALEDHTQLTRLGGSPTQSMFTSPSKLAKDALVRIGPGAVDPLIDALQNSSSLELRTGVARTLGRTGDTRAMKPLLRMTKDEEPQIRAASISGLSSLQSANILDLSDDEKERLRQEISGPIIDALETSITEGSYVVQEASARALRRTNNKRVAELLIAVAEQPPPVKVKQAAPYRRSFGKDRLPSTENRNSWSKARKAAIEALGDIKDGRAVRSLVRIMKDESDPMQAAAIRALGQIRNEAAIQALLNALVNNSCSAEAHSKVVDSLAWVKDRRVIEALLVEYGNNRIIAAAAKGKSYVLAGNRFKSLEEAKEWWERARKRLDEKQQWWWEDPPNRDEVEKYAGMKTTMQNGQVHVGMLIPDLVKLWGNPMLHMGRGRGKSFMIYMYKVGEIRSLTVNYENYQIVNIVDNMDNELDLKDGSESD
jgi:HEAT repeat protein